MDLVLIHLDESLDEVSLTELIVDIELGDESLRVVILFFVIEFENTVVDHAHE